MDGVLAVRLLSAAPRRVAKQIDADAAKEVGSLRSRFEAKRDAYPFFELRIPRGASCDGHREARRAPNDDASRPVGEAKTRESKPRDRSGDDRNVVVAVTRPIEHAGPEPLVPIEEPQPLCDGELSDQRERRSFHRTAAADGGDFGGKRRGAHGVSVPPPEWIRFPC